MANPLTVIHEGQGLMYLYGTWGENQNPQEMRFEITPQQQAQVRIGNSVIYLRRPHLRSLSRWLTHEIFGSSFMDILTELHSCKKELAEWKARYTNQEPLTGTDTSTTRPTLERNPDPTATPTEC